VIVYFTQFQFQYPIYGEKFQCSPFVAFVDDVVISLYTPKSGPDLAGGRPGPSCVFGISERDWLSNYGVLKIEGFGGKPPVGGRPGASPLNLALPQIVAK